LRGKTTVPHTTVFKVIAAKTIIPPLNPYVSSNTSAIGVNIVMDNEAPILARDMAIAFFL
jgi:hypothetical protein